MDENNAVKETSNMIGSEVECCGELPDGSGFAMVNMPLPRGHWLYAEHDNVPPMPFKMGTEHPSYSTIKGDVEAAAKYAIRAATLNGKIVDFDPDAMAQNFVVGMLGYCIGRPALRRMEPKGTP